MTRALDSDDMRTAASAVTSAARRLRGKLATVSSDDRRAAKDVGLSAAWQAWKKYDMATVRAASLHDHLENVANYAMRKFLSGIPSNSEEPHEISESTPTLLLGDDGRRKPANGREILERATLGNRAWDADDDGDEGDWPGMAEITRAAAERRAAFTHAEGADEEARSARRLTEETEARTRLALHVQEPDATILRRWGEPLADVASSLGLSVNAVKSRRKRLGPRIEAIMRSGTPPTVNKLEDLSDVDTRRRVFDPV